MSASAAALVASKFLHAGHWKSSTALTTTLASRGPILIEPSLLAAGGGGPTDTFFSEFLCTRVIAITAMNARTTAPMAKGTSRRRRSVPPSPAITRAPSLFLGLFGGFFCALIAAARPPAPHHRPWRLQLLPGAIVGPAALRAVGRHEGERAEGGLSSPPPTQPWLLLPSPADGHDVLLSTYLYSRFDAAYTAEYEAVL